MTVCDRGGKDHVTSHCQFFYNSRFYVLKLVARGSSKSSYALAIWVRVSPASLSCVSMRMMSCSETSKQTITMFSINSCLPSKLANMHCDLGFIHIKSHLQKIMPSEIITFIECCIKIFINFSVQATIYIL